MPDMTAFGLQERPHATRSPLIASDFQGRAQCRVHMEVHAMAPVTD